MSHTVTVAVVSWNTRGLLRECLASLEPDVRAGLADVWVVDNASTDGSAEMVREEFGWVRLMARDDNLGFGPAVNEVTERTTSEWVVPANADVAVEPGALSALIKAADVGVGVVAPRLIMRSGETQHSVHSFPTVALAARLNLGLYRLPRVGDRMCIEGYWDPERPREIDWAHGALLLVRRTAFDQVGGFDRDQWMYAEDIDLQWRLARTGWTIRYEPSARVKHAVSAATKAAFGDDRSARHVAATYAWMVRRRGLAVAWSYAAISTAGAAIRLLALAPAAAIRPARFGSSRARVALFARLHRRGLRRRRDLLEAVEPPATVGSKRL